MNCTRCGNALDTGAAYCGNCGQPVVPPAQPQPAAPVVAEATPNGQPAANIPVSQPEAVATGQVPAQPAVAVGVPPQTPAQPSGAVPAYAVPAPGAPRTKSTVGFVLGILSIPGCIIPIVGLGFGIAALVLGSKGMKLKQGLATAALVLGIIGTVLSLIVWIANANRIMKEREAGTTSLYTPFVR